MTPCVYITIYSGNKMPIFYIGSSTVEAILRKGYHGSVKSITYRRIWQDELIQNPHLFKTIILSRHNTKKEALEREEYIQRKLDVIKNPLYINKSYACKNGVFGRIGKGKDHPFHGKAGSEVPWHGLKRSEESKKRYSESKSGEKNPSSCDYEVYDKDGKLVKAFKGNFKQNMIDICNDATTINAFIKSYKTETKLTYERKGKTGPLPSWNRDFEGWYAVRKAPIHRLMTEENIKGMKHYYNPVTNEEIFSKYDVDGFVLGRSNTVKEKISQTKNASKGD